MPARAEEIYIMTNAPMTQGPRSSSIELLLCPQGALVPRRLVADLSRLNELLAVGPMTEMASLTTVFAVEASQGPAIYLPLPRGHPGRRSWFPAISPRPTTPGPQGGRLNATSQHGIVPNRMPLIKPDGSPYDGQTQPRQFRFENQAKICPQRPGTNISFYQAECVSLPQIFQKLVLLS